MGDGPQGHALGVLRAGRAGRAVVRDGATEPDARRRHFYLATLLCTCLALLAKIAAFPCVAVLALHRAFQPYLDASRAPDVALDWQRVLRDARRLLPHALVTIAAVVWYQAAVAEYGVTGWRGRGPLDPQHLATVATFAPLVIGGYLGSLVWTSQLSAFYRWPHVEIALSGAEKFAALAIALAIVAAVAYCCLRRRDLAFFVLAFLALLVPYFNLVFVDIWRADRYLYLASFCAISVPALLLAQLGARGARTVRIAIAAAAVVFALGSAAQTLVQQGVWRDSDSLWTHEASLDEPSLLALQSVATATVQRAEKETDPARRRELARAGAQRDRARHRAAIARSVACPPATPPPSRSSSRACTRCSGAAARCSASRSKRSSRTTRPPTRSRRIAPAPSTSRS